MEQLGEMRQLGNMEQLDEIRPLGDIVIEYWGAVWRIQIILIRIQM